MTHRRSSKDYIDVGPTTSYVYLTTPVPSAPLSPQEIVAINAQTVDQSMKIFHRRILMQSVVEEDIEEIILNGIETTYETDSTERLSRENHLRDLIRRVNMDYLTLRFTKEYEDAFVYILHRRAIRRIRYTLVIGIISIVAKSVYGWYTSNEYLRNREELSLGLSIGVALPCLLLACLCTFVEAWTSYCEYYTSGAFFIVCCVLTAEKLVLRRPGPILPLFICFVPIFGIARLRFDVCWKLVVLCIAIHLAAVLFARQENIPDVFFQGFSYLGGIVGGAVAHYRAEVLRRRNFVLYLPFCPESFDKCQLLCDMKTPCTSKHALLERVTLSFKNAQIEAAFSRSWYLIDGSPFQNTHKSTLHVNASRAIRYAVQTILLQQLLLGIQDWWYIYLPGKLEDHNPYWVTLGLRISVVLAYFGAQGLMKRYGQRYSKSWERKRQPPLLEENTAPLPSNYVRKMQLWSALIILQHVLSMGLIIVLFNNSGINSGVAAPCYYLALLNAVLFPHRSGFRVRFIFATAATLMVSFLFVIVCAVADPEHVIRYSTYIVITLTLGMMISHEEESLRRAFFVRRALHAYEFAAWHKALTRIRPFVRRKIAARRRRNNQRAVLTLPKLEKTPPIKIPTSNLLATASKYGMYSNGFQVLVAAGILVGYLW